MARAEVFNTRRRKLMRNRVPRAENYSVGLIMVALVALIVWVLATRDNFNAEERDLPIELLYQDKEAIEIYTRPLKPWVEPGSLSVTSQFDFGAFPEGVVDQEWRPVARVRHFEADNLYEKINGEAEKFIKQGFVSLDYLTLRSQNDGAELAIELFDQGDLGGSLGVFAEHAASREVETRNGVTFFTTRAGMIGRTGQHFFRVVGDRESQAIDKKSLALVNEFSTLGAVSAPTTTPQVPAGFALLRDGLGLSEAQIQFEESNVFQYDFANKFWFGSAGVDAKARVFIHLAQDEPQARALTDALMEEQSYEYETVPSDESWALFRHEYQQTYFVLSQRGRYVYGAEKLPNADDAPRVMRRLETVLNDG